MCTMYSPPHNSLSPACMGGQEANMNMINKHELSRIKPLTLHGSVGPHESCALAKPPEYAPQAPPTPSIIHSCSLFCTFPISSFAPLSSPIFPSFPIQPVAMQIFTQGRNRHPAPQLAALVHALTPASSAIFFLVPSLPINMDSTVATLQNQDTINLHAPCASNSPNTTCNSESTLSDK